MVSWIVDGDDGEDGGTLVGTKVVGTKQISSFLKLLVGWFGFVSDDGDGWGWMGIQNGSWLIAIFLFYELQLFHHKKASGDQISTTCWDGIRRCVGWDIFCGLPKCCLYRWMC